MLMIDPSFIHSFIHGWMDGWSGMGGGRTMFYVCWRDGDRDDQSNLSTIITDYQLSWTMSIKRTTTLCSATAHSAHAYHNSLISRGG